MNAPCSPLLSSEFPQPPPVFPTLSETWLNLSEVHDVGITFHGINQEPLFFSYAELVLRSKAVASFVKKHGIKQGDAIPFIASTSPEFIICFFGVLLAGAAPAPLDPPLGILNHTAYKQKTKNKLEAIAPRMVLTNERYQKAIEAITATMKGIDWIINSADLPLHANEEYFPLPSPNDIAIVQYSSGTTSAPKPVALSHHNVMANLTSISFHYLQFEPEQLCNVSWLPLHHDMGLIGNLLMPILWKAPNHLMSPQDFIARPWKWIQLIASTQAFSAAAPNFAYQLCLEKIKDEHLKGINLENWQWAICGAEMIVPETIQAFENRFAPWGLRKGTLVPAYGLAENVLAVTIGNHGKGLPSKTFSSRALQRMEAVSAPQGQRLAAVGNPIPGTALKINPIDGNPPEGVTLVGEILIKSESCMQGYFDQDESLKSPAPWLPTGDLGFIFEEELYVCGRKKNLIIRNGRNFFPGELEKSISEVKGIRHDSSIVLSVTEGNQEMIFAFAELEVALLSHATKQQTIHQQIRKIILGQHGLMIDRTFLVKPGGLPRTSSGKLQSQLTLRSFREGHLSIIS